MIYVTNEASTDGKMADHIESFSKKNHLNSINQPIKPYLIVVFNKTDHKGQSTLQAKKDNLAPKIGQFYRGFDVVCLPHIKNIEGFQESIEKIKKIIVDQQLQQVAKGFLEWTQYFVKDIIQPNLLRYHSLKPETLVATIEALRNLPNDLKKDQYNIDISYLEKIQLDRVFNVLVSIYKAKIKPNHPHENPNLHRDFGHIIHHFAKMFQYYSGKLDSNNEKGIKTLGEIAESIQSYIIFNTPCSNKSDDNITKCRIIQSRHGVGGCKLDGGSYTFANVKYDPTDESKGFKSNTEWEKDIELIKYHQDSQNDTSLEWLEYLTKDSTGLIIGLRYPLTQVCFGCLVRFPSEQLGCGHYSCMECLALATPEEKKPCLLCGVLTDGSSCTPTVPHQAGYRVMAADGGGVKGIVTSLNLEEIQKQLYGIPTYHLFDLIVGTSTGGLVALASSIPLPGETTPISAIELTKKYEMLSKEGFKKEFVASWDMTAGYAFGPRYISKCAEIVLKDLFRDENLLISSQSKTRIALTSTTNTPGVICVIPSYNLEKANSKGLVYHRDITPYQSSLATSAAPTYLKSRKVDSKPDEDTTYLTDGGMMANNPSEVGYHESFKIWGKEKKLDILVNLGCGSSNVPTETGDRIDNVLMYVSNTTTNNNKHWKNLKTYVAMNMYDEESNTIHIYSRIDLKGIVGLKEQLEKNEMFSLVVKKKRSGTKLFEFKKYSHYDSSRESKQRPYISSIKLEGILESSDQIGIKCRLECHREKEANRSLCFISNSPIKFKHLNKLADLQKQQPTNGIRATDHSQIVPDKRNLTVAQPISSSVPTVSQNIRASSEQVENSTNITV
ncbi:patatin family protein [Cavenderia fasciculata]|uniref:Patatin family protein n=1 Tax=Cavenderia fasciculata TaxID=261658 RepID=F4PZF6_CACFS|nr:patatin family protein [Cavenderia fasciculata]EGG19185.1 patatin family protein [Cavenderia fasciculata]|eukprot:XP_004366818.1 patatin family protein [Cavenderia fasciculata]